MIGMEANKIAITDEALRRGAEEGMDGFLKVLIDKYLEVTGGVVNAETMPLLNGYQHSLLGYHFLREEINEGGFVQLIQNKTTNFVGEKNNQSFHVVYEYLFYYQKT